MPTPFDKFAAASDDDESTLLVDIATGQSEGGGFAQPGALAEQYRPGDIIDGTYRLNQKLGAGGMGVVFSCTHRGLEKDYAIKLLSGRGVTVDMWNRFQKEAKVLARLNAPGIVAVHNMGIHEGKAPYLIMDLLSAESMSDVIRQSGPPPIKTTLRLFIQIAYALVTAHVQGIVHRDIKPANLMVVRNQAGKIESVKIVDFGIARWSKQGVAAQSETAAGTAVGTPFYMSPEQCQGGQIDLRSDIYSLGCAMFEALTGAPPFRGDNAFQTFMMHQSQPPPKLSQRLPSASFPPALERILDKMLAKDPADRYQSADEIARALTEVRRSMSDDVGSRTAAYDTDTKRGIRGRGEFAPAEPEDQELSQEFAGPQMPIKALAIVAALCIVCVLAVFGIVTLLEPPKHQAKAAYDPGIMDEDILAAGVRVKFARLKVDDKTTAHFTHYKFAEADEDENLCAARLKDILANRIRSGKMFFNRKSNMFDFPSDFFVGHISFGDIKPLAAAGIMPKQPGDAVFYQIYCLHENDSYVKLFADGDVQGLELQLDHLTGALEHIKGWKSIKHLSFFNSLVRPFPDQHKYDESGLEEEHLKYLKTLPNLQTLGLCRVNGAAVAALPCLGKLKSLRLQRIADVDRIIQKLPQYDNIEEVWLLDVKITEADLEPLTRMKNLHTLRLSRDRIDGKALTYFKKMKSLKKISLDDYLQASVAPQLKNLVPEVQFSCPVDDTYWQVMADKPVSTYY